MCTPLYDLISMSMPHSPPRPLASLTQCIQATPKPSDIERFCCAGGTDSAFNADRELLLHHLSMLTHAAQSSHSRAALDAHAEVKPVLDTILAEGNGSGVTPDSKVQAVEALAAMSTALQHLHADEFPSGRRGDSGGP